MASVAEVLSDRWAELGESPVWSERENCIWWVDTDGCAVLRTDATSGKTEVWPAPEPVGCLTLRPDGVILAGLASGIFRFLPDSSTFDLVCAPESRDDIRFNDGALDPAGRFWAGTMHRAITEPAGALFAIAADFTWTRVLDGFWTINGLAFDPARGRLYISDSHPSVQTIWVCDFDSATSAIANRRVFATTHGLAGRPDGACVDACGTYWIAGVGAGEIMRFTPDGVALPSLAVPVPHPTKIVIASGAGNMFITTRRTPGAAADDPSGHLLRCALPDPSPAARSAP